MEYEWDDDKNSKNLAKHGLAFERMDFFEWDDAVVFEDRRQNYSERRYAATSWIEGRLFICVHTLRGKVCRIISLRKANKRERDFYEKTIKTFD
jgi:uncharacterized protein